LLVAWPIVFSAAAAACFSSIMSSTALDPSAVNVQ